MTKTDTGLLTQMVAELSKQVVDLSERIKLLEENISVDGVYLDGAPDYVKMYMNKQKED